MHRTRTALAATAAALSVASASAGAAMMHPELGAKLSGMGEHGIVNLTSNMTKGELCWTFDVMTTGVTGASIRDKAGMVVAKLGTMYEKKACAMVDGKVLGSIETAPARYSVWLDTKGHPGDLRGTLFAGMAHMGHM